MLCRYKPLVSMAAWLFCPDYRSVWIVLQRWWWWWDWGGSSPLVCEQHTGESGWTPLLQCLSELLKWTLECLQLLHREIQGEEMGRITEKRWVIFGKLWISSPAPFTVFPWSGSSGSVIGFPMFLPRVSHGQKCTLPGWVGRKWKTDHIKHCDVLWNA